MRVSRWVPLVLLSAVAGISGLATRCPAQLAREESADSAFRRAQHLASEGNVEAARLLADSVLAASTEGTTPYVEALFWRATYAESTDQAKRDYLRIVVEFSLSPRAEDALLRLSQLELTVGDRVSAKRHLERLAAEHPGGRLSAQGSYWMGRLLLEDGNLPLACLSLTEARRGAGTTDVELANLASYYSRQCPALEKPADATETNVPPPQDSAARKSERQGGDGTVRKTQPSWSAQVAAFAEAKDAQALARRLAKRGFDARVTTLKPFRVRIGRYATRKDAQALVEKLRAQKMTALLVEAERP